ncbi:SDR family NAD(P)-dependent oxidoreductase [Arthrobacter sp. PAMC25564]|uniref:SDR family NAD(P)-dependent oxidoreductase n=1 Tax=Arthrobacter sp. PAMC25564 TaxID=2565366 RepID=UPI0010A23677|nr:SDR family NAD(P)-dependent oxidoreductase [Arthrobacter sp. PAMC25564]QCB97702.1 SDR family NAD(P)-dependent oxidoreductase [Arthrobacter sp. PAMC25564]
MDLRLQGKTVLITGASQGIGREMALLLAEEGCNLILVSRDARRLNGLADTCAGALLSLRGRPA